MRNPCSHGTYGSKNLNNLFGYSEGYNNHQIPNIPESIMFFSYWEDDKRILEAHGAMIQEDEEKGFGHKPENLGRIVFDVNTNTVVENSLNARLREICSACKAHDQKQKSRSRWNSAVQNTAVYYSSTAVAFASEILKNRSPYAMAAIQKENIFKALNEYATLFEVTNILSLFVDYPNEMEKIVKISPRTIKSGWQETIASELISENKKTAVPPALLTWANKQSSPSELLSVLQSICDHEDKNNAVIFQDFVNQMKRLKMIRQRWDSDIGVFYSKFRTVLDMEVGYTSKRLMDYLIRQNFFYGDFKGPYSEMNNLMDYVQMAVTAGLEFDKYPSNVTKGHNIMMRNLKALELTEEEVKEFVDYNTSMASKYELEMDGYVVVLPKTVEELVKEGNDLSHCVAGYSRRIARRETLVGFLRKASSPDVSLYTIEIDGNSVIQAKGSCNEDVPQDIFDLIHKIEKKWK